jgi:hypothetical protein
MKWNRVLFVILAATLIQVASGQSTDRQSDKVVTIKGKVLNRDLLPVEGAIFYVDNVKTNFRSKSNGTYKITVSPSAQKLRVESPVFGSSEIILKNQKVIDFTLGGVEGKESLTTASPNNTGIRDSLQRPAKRKAKKINTYNNIYQMIQAEVPGVVVNGRSITIPQGHSFLGSSEPLLVVNGVIVSTIDNINPLEVKSITFQRGSASAIYGERGSNGVLKITLLNGSENEN